MGPNGAGKSALLAGRYVVAGGTTAYPALLAETPTADPFSLAPAGLDAEQLAHFRAGADHLCQLSPVALIYVSHCPAEIPASLTRALRLDKGVGMVETLG